MVKVYGRYTRQAQEVSDDCARRLLEEPGSLFTTDPLEQNVCAYIYSRTTGESIELSPATLEDNPSLGADDDIYFSRTPVPVKGQHQTGYSEPPPPPPLDPLPGKGWGDLI